MRKIEERGKVYAIHKASDKLNNYYGNSMLSVIQFNGYDIQKAYVDGYSQSEQDLEVKDVDLEKESMNYLLNEHKSPLTKIMHGVDLGTEMQYYKDIQDAFKAGFKKAMEDKE